ncbi:nitrate/nitrite two-component system sensor histidine kinase NarQ [Avibacterium sp. 20-15]|uniref:nitrate/nitrite two-component system sensor histidine kinase NarQ n=1 Tax=unclassified Avibacterium TaxID=2685287 RepID=UPI002026E3A4|nr:MULTISPECIES: nitrate/nitrite two-component system sensor histidine kinase NarQ [unclassified Avibacterium]MCW9733114.1 nitrate/nitrite two-component system sensor histidine kinase NarQ [Avibacterium sp. 20-15]URL01881.1 nitrate/nitrite two-component system sensor histidine kinase NarQ [Avibacterium sp. 20-126]URL05238.1 nitrate/nitrite two-component system sensor histidine kinase NarQ [Avibacterium sp. 20-132]
MKIRKHSVATKIANYLLLIIIFATVISVLSLIIMLSNKSDAELINISGSLRMQSYRILYEMEHAPELVSKNLLQYRSTLHSSTLTDINHQFFMPNDIKQAYQHLIVRWKEMENYAKQMNYPSYQKEVANYVAEVNQFVEDLQHFAEKKLYLAVYCILFAMLSIVAMVSYVVWFTKKQMVKPLEKLALASTQVQIGQFNHIPLDSNNNDEIGRLALVFTQMASDLKKLYAGLEEKVNEKTQKLSQANRSLSMLYQCSQLVTTNNIDPTLLKQVLKQIKVNEHLRYIELLVYGAEHWNIQLGEKEAPLSTQQMELCVEGDKLGRLSWQAGLPCPDLRTMQNVSQMLSRSLYFHYTQRQQQQLLLMEERSIIARELHDSLAQVLAYLQIQLTLLKHNLNKDGEQNKEKSLTIIRDFEQALNDGYVQLRELLATFRLTVQEANLQLALEQVIDSLRNQTTMKMRVECSLPSHTFNAQQLVHALQIVREAALNAIKHSQGTEIEVVAHTNEDGEYELLVRDNGVGIPSLDEPAGHYGLNIMNERSAQLNAILSINNRPEGGTEVKMTLPNKL